MATVLPEGSPVTPGATVSAPETAGPTVSDLVSAYMACYAGRDRAIIYRLSEWCTLLGERIASSVTDDEVFFALERIAAAPRRLYAGRDADGKAIHRARGRRSGPTVNRYLMSLSAVFSWARRKRRLPRSFENPCHKVERQPDRPGIVRFLSNDERARLLAACRRSSWPKLYGLVLLALTTGARRGELLRLTWGDIDSERCLAYVRASAPGGHATKNGDAKTLPLTPAVLAELDPHRSANPARLVFGSSSRRGTAYNFVPHWHKALAVARVDSFRFHDLRHSCASYLAQEGASLLEIADVLGHRQLAMVKRYAHLTVGSKSALINRVLGHIT